MNVRRGFEHRDVHNSGDRVTIDPSGRCEGGSRRISPELGTEGAARADRVTGRAVTAHGERGLERVPNLVVMEQHIFREESDRNEAALDGGKVTTSVAFDGLPVAMELLAVALDDEPAVDQKVHAADALDPHLEFDVASDTPQDEPDQRLDAGLAASVQQTAEDAEPVRKPHEDVRDVAFVDMAQVPRAVERGDGVTWRLASDCLHKRFHEVGDRALSGRRGAPPVITDSLRSGWTSAGVRLLLDVQPRAATDEDADCLQ